MVRAERGEREILACQEGERLAAAAAWGAAVGGCRRRVGGGSRCSPSPVQHEHTGYPSSLLENMTLCLSVAVEEGMH